MTQKMILYIFRLVLLYTMMCLLTGEINPFYWGVYDKCMYVVYMVLSFHIEIDKK